MHMPKKVETHIIRHEWVIGKEDLPTTARDLRDGILLAERDMAELGIDLECDDAYTTTPSDGHQVTLSVEVGSDAFVPRMTRLALAQVIANSFWGMEAGRDPSPAEAPEPSAGDCQLAADVLRAFDAEAERTKR